MPLQNECRSKKSQTINHIKVIKPTKNSSIFYNQFTIMMYGAIPGCVALALSNLFTVSLLLLLCIPNAADDTDT